MDTPACTPTTTLSGTGEAVDHPGQFVFEKALAVRVEDLDDLLVTDTVGRGEAEVQGLPEPEGDRLQPELGGPVLVLRERHRVDDVQHEVAAAGALQFLQHLANPVGVVSQRRDVRGLAVGEEQVDVDRLHDGGEHVARSGRNGIQIVFRQVDAQARQQRIVRRYGSDEYQGQQHQRQGSEIALSIGGHGSVNLQFAGAKPQQLEPTYKPLHS